MIRTSEDGKKFIKCYESLALVAYPDPGSPLGRACSSRGLSMSGYKHVTNWQALSGDPWTNGWGHTKGVHEGQTCDQQTADNWFDEELPYYEALVENNVNVDLNQHQWNATVSILYNVGPGRAKTANDPGRDGIITLAAGRPSTLLRKLNEGDYAGCAAQFPAWNRGGGGVMSGLVLRRAAEKRMFEQGVYEFHK